MPTVPFTTDTQGNHTHTAPGWSWQNGNPTNPPAGNLGPVGFAGQPFNQIIVFAEGEHAHTVTGGDDETCPTNVSANYIIKL